MKSFETNDFSEKGEEGRGGWQGRKDSDRIGASPSSSAFHPLFSIFKLQSDKIADFFRRYAEKLLSLHKLKTTVFP